MGTLENDQNGSFVKFFNKLEKFFNVLEQSKSGKKLWFIGGNTRKRSKWEFFLSIEVSRQFIKMVTYGSEFRPTLSTVYCIFKNWQFSTSQAIAIGWKWVKIILKINFQTLKPLFIKAPEKKLKKKTIENKNVCSVLFRKIFLRQSEI